VLAFLHRTSTPLQTLPKIKLPLNCRPSRRWATAQST